MKKLFGQDGLLAKTLPGYEPRPGQEQMAVAVHQTLEGDCRSKGSDAAEYEDLSSGSSSYGRMLAVEAETGIGKTLAYLIPAALSRQKIIISTGTLNLQEQILTKEIPFIQQHISPGISALCVKGRQNYLCLYRWHHFLSDQRQRLFYDEGTLGKINAWLRHTESGDRAELPWLPDDAPLWREISSTASQCLGNHCPDEPGCFLNLLRKRAGAARLLIVNHHLFFSDLALRHGKFGEVLPRYESVIFDEAHHIENIATIYFGISFSHYQVLDLSNDIERLAKTELDSKERKRTSQILGALIEQMDHFANLFPKEKGKFPLVDLIGNKPWWENEIQALAGRLKRLEEHLRHLAVNEEIWNAMERRCLELAANLDRVTRDTSSGIRGQDYSYVRWFERREKTVTLSASPIEIVSVLRESLYDKIKSCIFTSATLGVGGKFGYFLETLGLPPETPTISLPSPFDYAGRTLLYIPNHEIDGFPPPGQENYLEKTQQRIYEILLASRGRALVLFTSINAMKSVHRFLVDRIPFPVMIQGEAPKNILLETFQKEADSILLAVASFWEGVNVPGESLSCVIIDKLPFEVPSDPVIMARINKIRQEGGNPFFDFQVPRAILSLRQGIGRLMRKSTDKGLLAIMDVRLFAKGYGRLFLKSLPPSPITRSLSDVQAFFSKK